MAKNRVIAGDYEGADISSFFGVVNLTKGFSLSLQLNKESVADYEVMDETSKKSATSAVGRAFLGGALLGPVGLLAGISAKSKGTHVVAVQFKDGKKSLIQMDDKIYKALMKVMF